MTDETKKAIKAFEAVRDDAENPILTIHGLKFFAVAEPACKEALSALRDRISRQNPQPLTLDELRGMDGEPVKIDDDGAILYGLVSLGGNCFTHDEVITLRNGDFYQFADISGNVGVYAFACRRKPEPPERS